MEFVGYHTTHNRIVGQILRSLREFNKTNLQICAKALGMSEITLSKVEDGTKVLSLNEFIAWCDFMKVDYGDALNGIKIVEAIIMNGGGLFKKATGNLSTKVIPFEVIKTIIRRMTFNPGFYHNIQAGTIKLG